MQSVGQLATGVAHTFNNMLQGILGNVELALMQAPDDLKPFLDNALASCADASGLVKDLLLFAGRHARPEKDIGSLSAVVERVVSLCRMTFDRNIAFELKHLSPLPPVPTFAHELEQALLGILLNARDALVGQPQGQIRIELGMLPAGAAERAQRPNSASHEPVAYVRVRDNGRGLPAVARGPAFEAFVRQLGEGGNRHGLANLGACAQLHGGWASLESTLPEEATPGQPQGTVVSLFLPCQAQAASAAAPSTPRGPVILVVDDDDIVRDSVARVLRFGGFAAFTAADGAAALQFIERGSPSPALVLMDESMPGMDGTTVRKQINKLAPEIRVVMISGHASIPGEGVHRALEKPVRADVLLDTIREALGLGPPAT